jgi:hypothetical protein
MKKTNTFSRKDFLKNSTLALTGLSMTQEFTQHKISSDNTAQLLGSKLTYKNVRLETGFEYEEGE